VAFSARDDPSAPEAYLAKTARNLSIPASERDAKNPFAPTAEVLSEARALTSPTIAPPATALTEAEKGRSDMISETQDSSVSKLLA
jgi:hypothetical protein